MISMHKSAALSGIDGYIVDVETDISNGMQQWANYNQGGQRLGGEITNVNETFQCLLLGFTREL